MGNAPSGCCECTNTLQLSKDRCMDGIGAEATVPESLVEFEFFPSAGGWVPEAEVVEGECAVSPLAKPLRLVPVRAVEGRRRGSAEERRQRLAKALPPSSGECVAGGKPLQRGGGGSQGEQQPGSALPEPDIFEGATFSSDNGDDREWHGSGVLTWPDGRVYAGQFLHGTLSGEATMTWPDGRMYSGQYRSNRKHGEGVFGWPDGRKYVGQWEDGVRHGWGLYTNAKGECRAGHWVQDQPMAWDPALPSEEPAAAPPREGAVEKGGGEGGWAKETEALTPDEPSNHVVPRSIIRAGGA